MTDQAVAERLQIPTFDDMLAAHERIKPYIHRTPVLTSSYLNSLVGAEMFFKCENFQKAGAFKVRGASNAVFGLSDEMAKKGVATHSSGNHALSLSYAAGRRGIPCHVVMPRTAPQAKKDAVRGYGGIITECEPSTSSREAVFAEVEARTGAEFVHPYNDPRVIAGQGTCSRELMEQVEGLDAVIAPIGGGGMISGTCLTLSNLAPKVEIFAAEPEQADDAYRSFKAGHIIADDAPNTVADGLKVPLKELTWHFVSEPRHRHPDRQRAGDHRRDEADLAADEDRDGAELRRAAGHHPEEQGPVRGQAGRRDHHRRQRRSRQAALDQGLNKGERR
jgi:threonine dehydratase